MVPSLPKDCEDFLASFSRGSVLLAFGMTFEPSEQLASKVVEVGKAMPDIGLVVGLKQSSKAFEVVREAQLKNIMLRPFVP